MSKTNLVSDDDYRLLEREKGDRSFSEVIEAHLQSGAKLADVTGQDIFESGTIDAVTNDIEAHSSRTLDRIDD